MYIKHMDNNFKGLSKYSTKVIQLSLFGKQWVSNTVEFLIYCYLTNCLKNVEANLLLL